MNIIKSYLAQLLSQSNTIYINNIFSAALHCDLNKTRIKLVFIFSKCHAISKWLLRGVDRKSQRLRTKARGTIPATLYDGLRMRKK